MPQRSPASSSLATLSEVPGTELRQLQATFESFREFVERYSPWLSDSNIFVETVEPVPVGAPVRLEIFLRDRPLLIRALGQVDWVRKQSDGGEDGPPGVALSITYLDPASARLIDSIFRLYTGQQSAAMGKDVVETWELDVESLIDQAFPGAEVSPEGAGGTAPKTASPGNDAGTHGTGPASPETVPTTSSPASTEAAVGAAAAVAAGAVAARSMAESSEAAPTASEPASADADSLDWTLPEGVVVAEPEASAEVPAAKEPPAADDSLDWTLPEGVVVADPGPAPSTEVSGVEPPPAAPADASTDSDSLDWTLPEGVVVAAPDRTLETQALQIPQEAADLPEELSDIELPDGELPDVEMLDVELPDVEIPVELEEAAAPEKDAPAEPMAAMPADSPEVKPPTAEPSAWADSELAPRPEADGAVADSAAASAAFPDPSRTVRVAIPPIASESAEEAEWEAKLSSAFSEYEEGESSEVVPPDNVALPEAAPPVAEDAGFGFGLVQESDAEPEEASAEPLPLEPAALEPATLESVASGPVASEPVAPQPVAPQPVAPPPSPAPTTPVQPSTLLEQAPFEAEAPSVNAVQQVAGAASAADESDASFLRRSVLAFLLAVVAVGLLFFWYRGRSAPPSGETTVAQAPVTPSPAPESTPPPSGATPGEAATPSAANPSVETPPASAPGEPSASPAGTEPGPSATVTEEPTPVEAAASPVESGSEVEPSPAVDPPSPPPPEPVAPPPPPPPVAAAQDPAEATAEIEQLITSWAAAWSEQNVAGYIDSYGPDYSPSDLGRKAWENQRKVRIQAPASLLVLAKDISVEILSATRARATFYQDYETDTKHLYTWKTMDLERIGERWRIVGERKGR